MRAAFGLGLAALFALASACSSSSDDGAPASGGTQASGGSGATGGGSGGAGGVGGGSAGAPSGGGSAGAAGNSGACVSVTDQTPVVIATAGSDDEYLLELPATSASHTSWAEKGNEALILEIRVGGAPRAHLVLHHGADGGSYALALGALASGDAVSVLVSPLSASAAQKSACVGPAKLTPAAALPDATGLTRAPVMKWPLEKRFDDLPIVLGWSKAKKEYQLVYTNENGGTVALCGGGATGIQAEIARWGRAVDIERIYDYGGASETWGRCTGSTDVATHPVQKDGAHPIFYYGDGHNRLFESRGGYGQACGSGGDAKADGDLEGFNVNNPGNEPANDDPFVLTLRLAPVDLDAIGYGQHNGRREGLVDQYAPWLYRLLDSELQREGKIDQQKSFPMQQYLYADVYAADVDGSGDQYCAFLGVSGGFKLRAKTGAKTIDGPQMTATYFGGQNDVKRIAIPLDQVYASGAFDSLVFDAYDNDGIYFLGLGDVFTPRPTGDNGATIDYEHQGKSNDNVYVDDDNSSCSGGVNGDGPAGPAPCAGSAYTLGL
jgi:hypothetical protein